MKAEIAAMVFMVWAYFAIVMLGATMIARMRSELHDCQKYIDELVAIIEDYNKVDQ